MAHRERMAQLPHEARKGGREERARTASAARSAPSPSAGGKNGRENPLKVRVYVLKVKRQNKRWPERHERRRKWPSPKTAAKLFLPKLRLGDHQPEDG